MVRIHVAYLMSHERHEFLSGTFHFFRVSLCDVCTNMVNKAGTEKKPPNNLILRSDVFLTKLWEKFLCNFLYKSSCDLKALFALFKNPTQQLHLLWCKETHPSSVETPRMSSV